MAFGSEAIVENLKLEANTKELKEKLQKVPYAVKLALADGLDHGTRSFLSNFYKRRLSGPPGVRSTPGGIFQRFRRVVVVNGRPVFLRQSASQDESIKAIAKSGKTALDMKVDIYTNSKAAGLLETGGDITSSKGMTIPLNDQAKQMKKDNPAAIDNLDFIIQNGKVFLGIKRGKMPPERLFILSHAVKVQPRLGFYSTWDSNMGRFNQIMDEALDDGLRAA